MSVSPNIVNNVDHMIKVVSTRFLFCKGNISPFLISEYGKQRYSNNI